MTRNLEVRIMQARLRRERRERGKHIPETWDGRICRICGGKIRYNQATSRYRHGEASR